MSAPLAQPNFDSIISTTLQDYNREATPQILKSTVVWYKLDEHGVIEESDGGRTFVEPVIHRENDTVTMIRGYEQYNITPQESSTAAEVEIKQMVGVVSISGIEEAINSGSKTRIVSLLDTKMTQLDETYVNRLGRFAYEDGSANGGRNFNGIDIFVEDGAAWGTYAGINRNAADGSGDFWRNQWISAGNTFTNVGIDNLRSIVNLCTIGNSEPDLILMPRLMHEKYESLMVNNQRYDMLKYDKKLGDAGFKALLFREIPVVWDTFHDNGLTNGSGTANGANTLISLNTKFIKFKALRGRNMIMTPFAKPIDQDARLAARLFYGNFISPAPYRHGRVLFTGI